VYSQVLYPNVIAFYPRAFMRAEGDFGVECIRAYNDFQTDFCSVAPDRLIPMANLPWWDLEASVVELERCYEMGHKGVNFGCEFEKVGLPRLREEHWDPLLSRVQEMGWPVNFHIGFNTEDVDVQAVMSMSKLDQITWTAKFFTGNIHCISELIMSRICHRYPTLNFVSVESGVGFIPYLVEALDWQFLNNNMYRDHPEMLLPSEYFRRQIYGTFWFEKDVVQIAELFPDNFMFESDFPHMTSLTPAEAYPYVKGPRDTIIDNLASIPEPLLAKLVHGNAARVYHLD
jgi:predicted TIM-barrel fold metal-dependent hydrolase